MSATTVRRGGARGLPTLAAAWAVALAGCTGQIISQGPGGPEDCPPDNGAPETPSITAPEEGRVDVIGEALTLTASAFVDPDGDPALEAQWEIWQLADGEPVQRVWSATITDPARMSAVTLADGAFEVGEALTRDKPYQAQVRYRSGAGCDSFSDWSAPRSFRTDDGSAYFFAEDQIRDVFLEISPEVLAALDAQAVPPGCVPYERETYPARMTFEGQTFDVGIKTKGGCGSARGVGGKPSWKINLEWDDPAVAGCPDEVELHGVDSITLNNEVQDGSFVHEHLAYHVYRLMGVAAPRANNVRVHVNGELWGLYLNVETVDRRMLGRSFASNDGMMYEGTYFCDLVSGNMPPSDDATDDTAQCIGREFEPDACDGPAEPGADPLTYGPIRTLVSQLEALPPGGFYPAIEQYLDFDAFLSMWAVDTVIGHWDGFVYEIMNNYRIYHDPSSGKWSVIPSGVDQTFQLSPPRPTEPFAPSSIVARRCLEEQACKDAFAARLADTLAVFQSADLVGRAQTIRDRIAADVQADPRKEVSYDGFLAQVDQTIQFIQGRAATVQARLSEAGY